MRYCAQRSGRVRGTPVQESVPQLDLPLPVTDLT